MDQETSDLTTSNKQIKSEIKTKNFIFESLNKSKIEIKISELCSHDYGFYIWPSSLVLAQFLYFNAHLFESNNILEIGAGTSLPGLMALRLNAKCVYLTDNLVKYPRIEDLIRHSIQLNELNEERAVVKHLNWGEFDEDLFKSLPKIDIILGSDVFFDSKLFEDLIATIRYLIEFNNKNLKFYTTYQVRSVGYMLKLNDLFDRYQLKCKQINLCDFDADKSCIAGSNAPQSHEIILFEIKNS